MKLYKLSAPGWTKEYDNDDDLRRELFTHICKPCRDGEKIYNESNELVYETDPVDENSDVYALLATACGCEFDIGEDEDRETHYDSLEKASEMHSDKGYQESTLEKVEEFAKQRNYTYTENQ